jgi:hypothetical protein
VTLARGESEEPGLTTMPSMIGKSSLVVFDFDHTMISDNSGTCLHVGVCVVVGVVGVDDDVVLTSRLSQRRYLASLSSCSVAALSFRKRKISALMQYSAAYLTIAMLCDSPYHSRTPCHNCRYLCCGKDFKSGCTAHGQAEGCREKKSVDFWNGRRDGISP